MTARTKEFIEWCLEQFALFEWKGLKKKLTKEKYREIASRTPEIEVRESLRPFGDLPTLKPDI